MGGFNPKVKMVPRVREDDGFSGSKWIPAFARMTGDPSRPLVLQGSTLIEVVLDGPRGAYPRELPSSISAVASQESALIEVELDGPRGGHPRELPSSISVMALQESELIEVELDGPRGAHPGGYRHPRARGDPF